MPKLVNKTFRLEGNLVRLYASDVDGEVIGYFMKHFTLKIPAEHKLDSK